jgi:hypothetical protein
MYLPDVALTAADGILLAGVALALWVGVATRQATVMLLLVLALAVGLSASAVPAAGWIGVLLVLPVKVFAFVRPR